MAVAAKTKAPLRQRAISELKELSILTGYLFIVIATMNIMKAAVLHSHGVEAAYWGVAIVKAAVLAKFIVLGRALKVGELKKSSPLIWQTLHKAVVFLVLLITLTVIEEVVVGLLHHKTVGDSLHDLFGLRLAESLAGVLVLLLVLIPYFAFDVLAEALGKGTLLTMFLVDRNADERHRSRIADRDVGKG